MEGPTPVSALIHAATMVTAGVYMCTRSAAIFAHAPAAMETVAIIGLATAFFAATIGLAQNDIKKVFAYSTVSQLGYMFLGVGVRRVFGGHLAPDDARVLQGAALPRRGQRDPRAAISEQDMRQMGGLRKNMPVDLLDAGLRVAGDLRRSRSRPASSARMRFWRAAYDACAVDVLGRRDHGRDDGVLCVARVLDDFLRRISGATSTSARIARCRCSVAAGRAGGSFALSAGSSSTSRRSSKRCSRWRKQSGGYDADRNLGGVRAWSGIGLAYYMYVINPKAPEAIRLAAGRALHADLQQVFRRRDLRCGGGESDGARARARCCGKRRGSGQ